MCSSGSTPPAIPENTIRSIGKWSSASCTVIAALTTLIPLRNRTTGRPSRLPVVNVTPFREYSDTFPARLALRIVNSGANAEITAIRGVVSSGPLALACMQTEMNRNIARLVTRIRTDRGALRECVIVACSGLGKWKNQAATAAAGIIARGLAKRNQTASVRENHHDHSMMPSRHLHEAA